MLLDKKEVMRRSSSNITGVLIDTINAMAQIIEAHSNKLTQLEKKINAPKKAKSTVAGTKTQSK